MKRILSFILVAILCLGVLTGCEQVGGIWDNVSGTVGGWLGLGGNETVGPTVDNAMTVLHNIMKEKNPITRDDYDVVAQVVAASDDGTKGTFKVTWTVDDDAIVIRESTKTGFYTVDLPDANAEEFTYTLTATISDDAGNKASKSYTFTFPVINNTGITSTPEEGVAYKIFLLQGSFQQRYYALATTQNNENKFINTDLDPAKAADFFVEKVDGGYKFYTNVDGVKTYVYAKTTKDESTGKISKYIGFSTEEGSVFSYNEAKGGVWTVKINDLVYGVGTYGTYTTISLSDESYFTPEKVGDSQFVIKFITSEYANTIGPDKPAEKEDDAKAILEKLYGLADGESASGSFTLTGKITALDSYGNPTIVVEGFEDKPVLCYKLTDERFEIGATITVTALSMKNYSGTYEFMSCTLDKFTAAGGSETPAGDLGVIAAPEVGTAYKFGLNHGGKGNIDVFFNGENYNNYAWYLAFTDNSAEAVDVYLENVEGVEGGLRLFFYNGDAKTYIVAFPRDGDTTKGTLKLDTAVPETYYTYSAEHKTLIYTSATGEQFYLGSSGTYGSISCSAISYITSSTSYIAHFYGEGGENSGNGGTDDPVTPHEHNFVEGKCECGETDPNYQPPTVDPEGNEIVFDFGANGAAGTHTDGNDIGTTKSFTSGNYTLELTDAYKAYVGGFDKAGNSILKFGTSSVAGTVTFVVPENVTSVIIYAARYKSYADNNIIVVNGTSYTLTANSDDGQYEAITVDTTTNKTVTIASSTSATKPRCVVNNIVWILGEGGSDTPVEPPHEHNFVEGKCECGETDPNYQPPHEHNFVEGKCECGETDPNYVPPTVDPETPEQTKGGSADFDTLLPGSNGSSSYTTSYTTTDGWVINNSAIQAGGTTDMNPQFTVIGPDNSHKAICMNGKVSAPGAITSPTLAGGVSKITINYTKIFTDTELSFDVIVTNLATGEKQTYNVAKTLDKNEKYVVYTAEIVLDTAIAGEFTIELVNKCPTSNTGNKDRVTILSIDWE